MKLTFLALQQGLFLILGVGLIAKAAADPGPWWWNIAASAVGAGVLLGALAARDRIREETAMARRLATLKKQTEDMEVDQ